MNKLIIFGDISDDLPGPSACPRKQQLLICSIEIHPSHSCKATAADKVADSKFHYYELYIREEDFKDESWEYLNRIGEKNLS